MSAPTTLDGEALSRGLAVRVVPAVRRPVARGLKHSLGRRSPGRLAQLTREHDQLCTQAVDSFEIAAGLEAAGVSDRRARSQFDVASVFELAEMMYELVPRRPSPAEPATDPWRRSPARAFLRGLLYGLPGLLFIVALRIIQVPLSVTLLVAATIVACALGQLLSFLGHVLLGRGDRRAARALMRVALLAGAAPVAGLSVAALLTHSPTLRLSVFAASEVEYLLAATVLMVLNADVLLLAILAPGVVLSGLVLCGAVPDLPPWVALGGLGLCLLTAVAAAWMRLRTPDSRSGRRLRDALRGGELPVSVCFLAYGGFSAAMLSFAIVDAVTGSGSATGPTVAFSMLPLIASLGAADWLQYRLRSRTAHAMRDSTSVDGFARRARLELVLALLAYAGTLAVLTGALLGCLTRWGGVDRVFALDATGYMVLGLALFLSTILLSCGLHRLIVAVTGAALAVDAGLRWPLTGTGGPVPLALAHVAVFSVLLVVLLAVSAVEFGRLARHR